MEKLLKGAVTELTRGAPKGDTHNPAAQKTLLNP